MSTTKPAVRIHTFARPRSPKNKTREIFSISLAPITMAFATPVAVYTVDGGTVQPMQMDCCNTTNPVCDKSVDKSILIVAFKTTTGTKTKHPKMEGANVGFCSTGLRLRRFPIEVRRDSVSAVEEVEQARKVKPSVACAQRPIGRWHMAGAKIQYNAQPARLVERFMRIFGSDHSRQPSCHMADAAMPSGARTVSDPVCGMWLDPCRATTKVVHQRTLYGFCFDACARVAP